MDYPSIKIVKVMSILTLLTPYYVLADESDKEVIRLEDVDVIGTLENSILSTSTESGQKIENSLKNSARSISVINNTQLKLFNPQTVSEALNYSAGIFTGIVGASKRFDYITLRGFKDNMTDNLYLDGTRLLGETNSFAILQIDPYFIEHIETIKGPASSTYGAASPGGLVMLNSKLATPIKTKNEIAVEAGNLHTNTSQLDISNTTTNKNFSYRLVGMYHDSNSQQGTMGYRRFGFMPSVYWVLTENSILTLQAYYQKDLEGGYHSGLPFEGTVVDHNGYQFPLDFSDTDPNDYFNRKQQFYAYHFTHFFPNEWQFNSKLRYSRVNVKLRQNWQTGWLDDTYLSRRAMQSEDELKSLTLDNNIVGHLTWGEMQHDFSLGMDFQKRKTNTDIIYDDNPTKLNVYHANRAQFKQQFLDDPVADIYQFTQLGLYLQNQFNWHNWYMTLGARYDKVKSTSESQLNQDNDYVWKGHHWSWNTSLLYAFNNGISTYINYSTGFNKNTYRGEGGNLLKPTTSHEYEVGLKYQSPDNKHLLTLAIFDLEQKNVANRVINGNYYIPAGTIRAKGIELEDKYQLTTAWYIQGAIAYNDIKYTKTSSANKELMNKTPYQAPKLTASLWNYVTLQNGINLGVGVRHTGKMWADNENTHKLPAYTVADLSLSYDFSKKFPKAKGLKLNTQVKNLFNKKYTASCAGLDYCYSGEKRAILGKLSYEW